jgi:hypothetical protein
MYSRELTLPQSTVGKRWTHESLAFIERRKSIYILVWFGRLLHTVLFVYWCASGVPPPLKCTLCIGTLSEYK